MQDHDFINIKGCRVIYMKNNQRLVCENKLNLSAQNKALNNFVQSWLNFNERLNYFRNYFVEQNRQFLDKDYKPKWNRSL